MPCVYDNEGRRRKAITMVAVLQDYSDRTLDQLTLLDVGSSSGIIDDYLASHCKHVTGVDIDAEAMAFSQKEFGKDNLVFEQGDAMNLCFDGDTFDLVVCSQVYEHVPDAALMFAEIYRVLKPGGACYFSGNNRFMWMEPHYHLPLLSVMPRYFAHYYMRLAGKGDYYHEKHLTYWGLKRITDKFRRMDYTLEVIENPAKYHVEYLLAPGTPKWKAACLFARYCYWATPHIWLLQKPLYK